MTNLRNSLRDKKAYLESVLSTIHSKNNGSVESYSRKELLRCTMIIRHIKRVDARLENCPSDTLTIA
jgi:hypothetical protein